MGAAEGAAPCAAPPVPRREYAVDLACGACEAAVHAALAALPGVTSATASAAAQTVVVDGGAEPEDIVAALAATGRAARLVGQGATDAVPAHVGPAEENAACVAEFKGAAHGTGPLRGVVRVAQLTADVARCEMALAGLPPGRPFCVAVHAAGDLRDGAASTGAPWPHPQGALLAAGVADAAGGGRVATPAAAVRAWELLGRAAVVHAGGVPDAPGGARLAAAVLARAAAVGTNAKRVCACDGTVIWNADALA